MPGPKCWIWKKPSESYMNFCTQAPGHCFSATYNFGMPTPWLQHAALVSTAPEGHRAIREGQLKLAKGGSSWQRWRVQKGCKLEAWSLWGRLRPSGYYQGSSLPSWFYKGNAKLLFAKLQSIRTLGSSMKLLWDQFKIDERKLLHKMGSLLPQQWGCKWYKQVQRNKGIKGP